MRNYRVRFQKTIDLLHERPSEQGHPSGGRICPVKKVGGCGKATAAPTRGDGFTVSQAVIECDALAVS